MFWVKSVGEVIKGGGGGAAGGGGGGLGGGGLYQRLGQLGVVIPCIKVASEIS